jgi:hypothetical protein
MGFPIGDNEFCVEKNNKWQVEEIHFVGFLSKLLETKLMHVLRFKHGQVSMHASCVFFDCNICWSNFYLIGSCAQIYSAVVSVFLGGNKPSRTGNVRGDISINFSCDPAISSKLVGFYNRNLSFLFLF